MAALGAVGHEGSPDAYRMVFFSIAASTVAPLTVSISGTITDDTGAPTERTIRVYRRSDGVLLGETTSNAGTGEYIVDLPAGEVQRIVLDDGAGTVYNDLIDRVIPA